MRYCCIILLLISVVASAAVYKSVDKDGNVTYSDQPSSATSKPLDLPPSNVSRPAMDKPNLPAVQGIEPPTSGQQDLTLQTPNEQQYEYNYFAIDSPKDQQTFQNQRLIDVKIMLKPPLKNTDTVQLLLDGDPYGGFFNYNPEQKDQPFIVTLNNVPRGSHTLQGILRDVNKIVVMQTAKITIFIHYHHTQNSTLNIVVVPRRNV